ncbi:hypothetical protein EDB82DRAFT_3888 [Fusarium venenatum]|uniref:uncharacterized protein n=1 Tax=Fusarium venenatum TaxID=56646 RepID=UPI001DFC2F63|nr:hypothetical protein EDB82DRAFT_3888 [Fusarium venenatum]
MMEQNQKLESIASHVAKTFESFRGLEDALTETDSFDGSSKGAALRELLPTVENDFTRFKMWAGNQAAHQSGPFSLDCRLKEAPHLQQQVIHLLIDICESLQDALSKTFATPDPLNQDQERGRDHQNTQNKEASSANSARDRESEFSDSDSDLGSGTATVAFSTLVLDVGEAIDCLLRLSVAIANPATHEHFQKLGVGPSEDVSFYEPHDIAYVRDKFPKISDKLANTLGRYITRRRQSFKYLQAHHEELPSSAKTLASNNEADTFYTEVVPRSFTSSLTRPFETLATFDPQASVIDEDIRSDSGISERSYITSDGSTFEGTDQETHKPAPLLRVPPRPSAAEDGTFECPFCYKTISAGTRTEWKQHVFGDLRPYICVFSNCTNSNIDFGRLHNWQLHFSKYHWRSWSCPFECQQPLSSAEELSSHIKDQHFPSGTEGEIKLVTTLGEKPASEDTSGHCLLCGHSVTGLEKYIKHVGRHLEQLALFALPNFEIENPKRESESKEQNSVKFGTGAKNVCKICRGVFTTKSNLKRHEDRNHGEWDWHDELDRFSTGLFPILEPQKQPSPDLPVEEENEKEEIDFYGPNKNPENPQGLSEKAKGKLPTTQKSWEDTQQQTESPNTIQDMKLSRTMDSKSEYGKFPDYTPWSKGDMPSLEDFIEDSERIHDMLSGQNISASTVDLVEPLSPSLKYRLEDSANQILDGSIWNLENENENSWFGFDKDEWIMDITGQARGVSPGKAHPYQRPLPPLPSQNKAAEVAGEMFDTTSERQRDSDLQLQSEVHPPQVKLTPITRQLAAPSTRYQASYNCDECPKTFSREVHLRFVISYVALYTYC